MADPKRLAGVVLQRYGAAPRMIGDLMSLYAADVRTGDKVIMARCHRQPPRGQNVTIEKQPLAPGETQATWLVVP